MLWWCDVVVLWCVVLRKTYNILKYLTRKTSANPGLLQATPRQHDLTWGGWESLGHYTSHKDTKRVTGRSHALSVPPTPTVCLFVCFFVCLFVCMAGPGVIDVAPSCG